MSHVLLSRTLSLCVNTCCLHTCLYPHRVENMFGFKPRCTPGHYNQVWLDDFFLECHPSSHCVWVSPLPVNHCYHKTTLKPHGTIWLVISTTINFKVPFFFWFLNPQASAPSTSGTHTDEGAVIRQPGSTWLESTPAMDHEINCKP